VLTGDVLVAAIADGAGSASMAERGAEIAVVSFIAHLKCGLEDKVTDFNSLLREAAVSARTAITVEAELKRMKVRSYASTLLGIVLTPAGGGALQIGDGVIVVGEGRDEWDWVFWPQRGEYANTTNFLTDDDAIQRLEIEGFSSAITDVALMSDGLESLALNYASSTVYDPFFNGMFQPLLKATGDAKIDALSVSLEKFLSSERVVSRTDDDVSLILATRRKDEPSQ